MTPSRHPILKSVGHVRPQHGFAAVAAIFLVVVLAALGGFMLTFSNTQQITSVQDLQGTRGYWAAQAGVEWGVGRVAAVATPSTISATTCSTSTPLSIDGFSVTVVCTSTAYAEAGVSKYLIELTSTASSAGGTVGAIGFVERSLSATMER